MNWMAANEQREDALLRVFFMLVAMALLKVRIGMEVRHEFALLSLESALSRDEARIGQLPQPLERDLYCHVLYCEVLALLAAAEAAARQLTTMTVRAAYEFLNQAYMLSRPAVMLTIAGQWEPTRPRLDSS